MLSRRAALLATHLVQSKEAQVGIARDGASLWLVSVVRGNVVLLVNERAGVSDDGSVAALVSDTTTLPSEEASQRRYGEDGEPCASLIQRAYRRYVARRDMRQVHDYMAANPYLYGGLLPPLPIDDEDDRVDAVFDQLYVGTLDGCDYDEHMRAMQVSTEYRDATKGGSMIDEYELAIDHSGDIRNLRFSPNCADAYDSDDSDEEMPPLVALHIYSGDDGVEDMPPPGLVSPMVGRNASDAEQRPQVALDAREHRLYSEVLANALTTSIALNWNWSCGLKSMAMILKVPATSDVMQVRWRSLLEAYIKGFDYEQVPGVYHHMVHNGYWQTFGGDTINRLARWGDEWLMGVAYGIAWLVQFGPLGLVSDQWHMMQLGMQNVLHAHTVRIQWLCSHRLLGDAWDPVEWARFLKDISIAVGVNPLTWPAWCVFGEWMVSKGMVPPSAMQRRVEVYSIGPLASGYDADLTAFHIFQQCTGWERYFLQMEAGHVEAKSWHWDGPWRPRDVPVDKWALGGHDPCHRDKYSRALFVLKPDPLPLHVTMGRPITINLRDAICFAQPSVAVNGVTVKAEDDGNITEEFLQALRDAVALAETIDFDSFTRDERQQMVTP